MSIAVKRKELLAEKITMMFADLKLLSSKHVDGMAATMGKGRWTCSLIPMVDNGR